MMYCKRLMKNHAYLIDGFRDIFIQISKGIISNKNIYLVTSKYNILLKELGEIYRCIRSLFISDDVVFKTNIYIKNHGFVERIEVASNTICSFI